MKSIFNPKSVAVIGATDRPGSVGLGICKNLIGGEKRRKIYFVNLKKKSFFGRTTLPTIEKIKEDVELAVIAIPASGVPEVARQAVRKGVKSIIVISAGFAETGEKGQKLQEEVVKICKEGNVNLVGPNCLGVIRPHTDLNASFAPLSPNPGGIGFISQSGALIDAVVGEAKGERYGFSSIISYGNGAGLGLSDFLDYLRRDEKTKVAAVYLEGVNDGKRFRRSLRKAAQQKPVLILKGGKTEAGQKAASSHTASMTGESEIYSAVFRQEKAKEVNTLRQLINGAKALSWQNEFSGKLAVVTNGGGAGILAADYAEKRGLHLGNLTSETTEALKKSEIMHSGFSRSNPLDIVGDAGARRYEVAVEAVLKQNDIGAVLAIQTPQIMTEPEKNAEVLCSLKRKYPRKVIVACFMGGVLSRGGISILEREKIPNFFEVSDAVDALTLLKNK